MLARAVAGCCALGLLASCGVAHRPEPAGGADASGGGPDGSTLDASHGDAQSPGTWTVVVVDEFASEGSLQAGDGGLHVVYRSAVDDDLLHAHRPAGASWQEPVVVDGGPERDSLPSLAIDGAGTLHVSYYDFTNEDLVYASRPAGGDWSAPEIADPGNGVGVGLFNSLVTDESGTVHVTYWSHVGAFDLMYVNRTVAGVWSAPEIVDAEGTVGSRGSLAIDADGGLHASYMDTSDDTVSYAYRTPAGDWSVPETAAAFTNTICESQSSLDVDLSGGVHLSYFDCDLEVLRYAYRAPAGGWDAPVTVAEGGAGETSSLVVDEAGGVHISYGDARLGYAHRTASGSWDAVEIADGADEVGRNSSLAIDAAGTVHITYHDAGNQRLKHAHRTP